METHDPATYGQTSVPSKLPRILWAEERSKVMSRPREGLVSISNLVGLGKLINNSVIG